MSVWPAAARSFLDLFVGLIEIWDLWRIKGVIYDYNHQHHRLAVSHSLHIDVSPSTSSLHTHLSDTIQTEVSKSPSSLCSPLVSIPHSPIDQIIRHDFEKEKPVQGVYIYLINLGQQSKSYAYNYGYGDSSPAFTKCLGTIWTCKERYIWIDLAASPVDYGPALSGEGVLPRGESHPLAALHGGPKSQKAFLAEMASLASLDLWRIKGFNYQLAS